MGNTMPTSTITTTPIGGLLMNCGPPPAVNDASVTIVHRNIANYTCNDGYDMTGSPTNLTCDQRQWVGYPPECNPRFLDIDPYGLSENVPLWLTLTLAAIGTFAALVLTCCLVSVCCLGKNRKRRKIKDSEELCVGNPMTDGIPSKQMYKEPQSRTL